MDGGGSALRVLGPQASAAAVLGAFDSPAQAGRARKRSFDDAFRAQPFAAVPVSSGSPTAPFPRGQEQADVCSNFVTHRSETPRPLPEVRQVGVLV